MSDIAIKIENLSKMYRIGEKQERYYTFRDTLTNIALAPFRRLRRIGKPPKEEEIIWALKDVSFEVKHGEVVGIIGRNGAGKTTLLKILSRITEPTEGQAEIHGRVGSLLEVGTGFHPELTGRENIFLNGAILGMRKTEIDRKFDDIVAFAEIEKFIDTPVKHYSSGMYMRLAFAVAAHLEPEILLVDEVLAVGDAMFQRKCLGKMGDVAKEGRTVLFVSHNMGAITHLCGRVFWLDSGQLKISGKSSKVVEKYLSAGTPANGIWKRCADTNYASEIQILSARVISNNNTPTAIVSFKESFKIIVEYELKQSIRDLAVLLRLTDALGHIIFTTWDTDTTDLKGSYRRPGMYCSICELPPYLLRPGHYWVTISTYIHNVKTIEYLENALSFEVSSADFPINENRIGIITPILKWTWEVINL